MPVSEELTAKIDALQSRYDTLQDEVAMADVTRTLGDTASEIAGLPGKVAEIRSKGYAYANFLEHKAETLNTQWASIHTQISDAIRSELEKAQGKIEELDAVWDKVEAAVAAQAETPAQVKPRTVSLAAQLKTAMAEEKNSGKSDLGMSLADRMKEAKKTSSAGSMGAALSSAAPKTSSAGSLAGALASASKPDEPKPATGGSMGNLADKMKAASTQASDDKLDKLVDDLDEKMNDVQKSIADAKERIRGLYGEVPNNVSQTQSHIRDIETYLERAENATFEFNAGEDVFMVVKAEWKDGPDEPEGFVYTTNQRLVMEQQEKKGGFMGFGKKKVESLLWESPIGAITKVSHEKKGMLGRIDLIHLEFGSGGPFGKTTIEVKDGLHAEWYANKLKRAVSGEVENERGIQRDPAEIEALENAPTMCGVCGATFNQAIVRGMTTLECAYCGSVVRLKGN